MSDPQPPAWNPQDRPSQPYDGPPHTAPLSQYGRPPSQQGHPQYGNQPQGHPQYGYQHYGNQQYGNQPYGAPPQYGVQPQYPGSQPPPRKPKRPWLPIGAGAVVLVLVAGVVAFVATRGGDDTAGAGLPTATYSDAVTTPSADPATEPPTPAYTQSATPAPEPTPAPERRRTLKDIDTGLLVYDDVYVQPVKGWRKLYATKSTMTLGPASKGAIMLVVVNPVGYPAAKTVPIIVRDVIGLDKLTGVVKGPVKTLPPANSNIQSQAQMSYSGRLRQNGASVSLTARCTTMTGVESVHNVTVSVCVEARTDLTGTAFRDADRMLASVARSI
ncbi:hypothetical protein ACQHIV_26910 [Kribbella sp. GL6]|uniref:hypothetical protein n=1 Tax=Kribbella sp. GL6 TaxID=3419765 RepID=UPI003D014A3D